MDYNLLHDGCQYVFSAFKHGEKQACNDIPAQYADRNLTAIKTFRFDYENLEKKGMRDTINHLFAIGTVFIFRCPRLAYGPCYRVKVMLSREPASKTQNKELKCCFFFSAWQSL